MGTDDHLVVFSLDDCKYALNLSAVARVIPSVAVTPLPEAPPIILGVIKIREKIIPVVNIRRRFHLPGRELGLDDQIIIAKTKKRAVGLVVDSVAGVEKHDHLRTVTKEKILSSLKYVEGIIQMEEGLVLIHDLDQFLSLEEEEALDAAMEKERNTK